MAGFRRSHLLDLVFGAGDFDDTASTSDDASDDGDESVELFVGNLPYDVMVAELRDYFCNVLGIVSTVRDCFYAVEVKNPRNSGRPFGFVLLDRIQTAHRIFLAEPLYFQGRQLRIERSHRPEFRQLTAEHNQYSQRNEDQATGNVVQSAASSMASQESVTSATSAYTVWRSLAKTELDSLEQEFDQHFQQTSQKLTDFHERLKEKEAKKKLLKTQIGQLQQNLSQCETEMAEIEADRTQLEDGFSNFSKEHEAKVATVKSRISRLRSDQGIDDTKVDVSKLPSSLVDELDCIICYETSQTGQVIFQCSEGHLICKNCHNRLNECPVCRQPYARPGIRNRLAEALAEAVCAASAQTTSTNNAQDNGNSTKEKQSRVVSCQLKTEEKN